ncbi:hypothetical protein ABB07_27560 [Streptomyces incarnatus]|uniref:Uncharacterized protein n=1 Tax=Streptomyces incarnatus TaxID=665007 RepID=A0ABM5TRB2_9ACTN|nr:hypothetical protein [Streptomyces incarnatus]AKJ13656.1 hypothetical protein ABB07_27560 [Streptomyces incarnatus]
MTNLKFRHTDPAGLWSDSEADLAALRGDCARMAPHWAVPEHAEPGPVLPSLIHGVTVPARSARLLDAMSDYGD